LLIGACIYGAYSLFGTPEEDFRETRIVVDANRINAYISEWESRWNRPPTRQELEAVIQQYVREDILYRQAVAMGLNEDDPITRRRMAQKLEYLTSDLASIKQPAEGELEQYFQNNRERYKRPDQISFVQVFINPDARGKTALDDAAEILVQLRAQLQTLGPPDSQTLQAGDPLMLQNHFSTITERGIARHFGSGFAAAVMQLEVGQWHGPVLSGYGLHLVYLSDSQIAPPTQLQEVKAIVLEDWHLVQREKFNTAFYEALKDNYEIIIDELPADRLIEAPAAAIKKDETVDANVSSS
jgi:hypothetical protein